MATMKKTTIRSRIRVQRRKLAKAVAAHKKAAASAKKAAIEAKAAQTELTSLADLLSNMEKVEKQMLALRKKKKR